MTDAFATLGLTRDADERAIKRAYAALLRVHRPDDDPAGFQRINEAYQSALQWRQWRDSLPPDIDVDADDEAFDEDATDDVEGTAIGDAPVRARAPEHAPEVHHADQIRIRVTDVEVDAAGDGDGFDVPAPPPAGPVPPPLPDGPMGVQDAAVPTPVAAALQVAARGDAAALLAWLRAEPTFWSLQDKAWWGEQVMHALQAQPVPMPPEAFDALMGFFGLDDVHASRHHLQLAWLRDRCLQWWRLQPRPSARGLSRVQLAALASERANVARVQGPFRWHRVLWQSLRPGVPDGMAAFVQGLGRWHDDDLPPNIDGRTLAFWRDARADIPVVSRARFAVFAARTLGFGGVFALFVMLGGMQDPEATRIMLLAGAGLTLAWIAGIALLWLAVTSFIRWEPTRWRPEWPVWVVPALAALTVAAQLRGTAGDGAQWLAGATLFLQAWREVYRWLIHRPGTINAVVWLAFALCAVAASTMAALMTPGVVLAVALIRWGKMVWSIRRRFRAA